MFLVLTRSPRCVKHFRVYPDKFRRSNFRKYENESKREKKLKKKLYLLHTILSFAFFSMAFDLAFYFFSFSLSGTHMSLFLHFSVHFSPETIYFVPVSISFILIEYSLNIFHFSEFFKNLVFRFNSKLVA